MNRVSWILAGLFVVLVVVLIFLLGNGDPGDTTTSLPGSTTTLSGATTTPAETSTTAAEATTTVAETTTTTVAETTTTGLEGNWGADPLVVSGFGALGWWTGDAWVQVEQGTDLPVGGGEDYQVAYLGLEAVISGGGQVTICEPLENPGVDLSNGQLLGEWPGPFGVAVSASWELTPHLVEEIDDDGSYAGFARVLLADRGLDVPEPVIKQLLRVDLEGDGVNEVLIVAEDVSPDLFAQPGDYSIAFLRKVVQGQVETAVIGDSVVAEVEEGETPFILSFAIGAVADLSGDGKMEIVLSSKYYEGAGVEVWEYVNDDLGPVRQIGQGCGV